jgi:hypothetical protein
MFDKIEKNQENSSSYHMFGDKEEQRKLEEEDMGTDELRTFKFKEGAIGLPIEFNWLQSEFYYCINLPEKEQSCRSSWALSSSSFFRDRWCI